MVNIIKNFEDCDFFSILPEGIVKHRGYYYANEDSKTGYSVVEPCGCEIPMEVIKKNKGKERRVLDIALENTKQCIGEITTEQMINWLAGVTPVRAEDIPLLIPGEYVLVNEKTPVLKGNYLLIATDGYSLEDYTFYDTFKDAQIAMQKAYERCTPDNWIESDKEMSSCNKENAILYANGENVFVWTIIKLIK